MAGSVGTSRSNGSLTSASADRLTCLLRHWTWADEARARFEQELANGWDDNEEPVADHPFGAYYHWCALLCGLSEAALEHGLLSPWQLEAIRGDLEDSLPGLRACRQLLVVIPASRNSITPLSAISSSASSHETGANAPLPRAPRRRSGVRSRCS